MGFTRCYSCMQELDRPGGRCPRCGNENNTLARSQPSHALPCGYLLHGRYVIGKTLGQGGFGMTYIGWDLALETRVCIKEYFPAGAAMRSSTMSTTVTWSGGNNAEELKGGRESFIKEARKAVKLRKLNAVVQVWDVFYENETAYLVMDYVEGVTLKRHLTETRKPLSEEECVRLLMPVMKDLEAVHARGIIHRDISPDNLMLQTDGTLVLLDIGAAKDLSRGNGQSSMLVAKKGFSPLEQYATGGSIGPWTDVYAMCATIVYCVTGGLIPTPMDRISGEKLDLSGFTPAFAEVLKKGLAIRPKERIQTMSELANSLIVATKPMATPEPIPEPTLERVPVPTPELQPELKPTPTPKPAHDPVSKPAPKPPEPKEETERKKREAKEEAERLKQEEKERRAREKAARIEKEKREKAARAEKERQEKAARLAAKKQAQEAKKQAEPVGGGEKKKPKPALLLGATAVLAAAVFFGVTRLTDLETVYGKKLLLTALRYEIGWIYENGYGVEQDYAKALEWYTKVAEAGNIYAMNNIGEFYQNGFGVEQDYAKAMEWYTRAAEAGNMYAMHSIGGMYQNGFGVERDYAKAMEWYTRAAEAGNMYAMHSIGGMYQNGFGVERDYAKAMEWYTKAAEAGNIYAMHSIGWMYENGCGVERDYAKAMEWYTKAAEAGNMYAMHNIGGMYQNGFGVERDYAKAMEWYTRAAEAGNPYAMNSIGWMYQNGVGVKKDKAMADEWYAKAEAAGFID